MTVDICQLVADLLPLYLEGEVAPKTREFIASHLENCQPCQQLYASCSTALVHESGLRSAVAEQDAMERRAAHLLRRIKRTLVAGAAVLALVIAVTSVASYYSGATLTRRFEKAESLGLFTSVNVTRRCGTRLIRLERMLADATSTSFIFHESTELSGLAVRLHDDGGYEYDARQGSWVIEEAQEKVAVFEALRQGVATLTLTFTDLRSRQRVQIEIDLPAEELTRARRTALGLSRVYAPRLAVDVRGATLSLDKLCFGMTESVVDYSVSWRGCDGINQGWPIRGSLPTDATATYIQLWEGKTRVRRHADPPALAEFPEERIALGRAVFDPVASFASRLTLRFDDLYGYFRADVRVTTPLTRAGYLIAQVVAMDGYRLSLWEIRREGDDYVLSYDVTDGEGNKVEAFIDARLEPIREGGAAPAPAAVVGVLKPGSTGLRFPTESVEQLFSGRVGTSDVTLRVTRLGIKLPRAEISVPLFSLNPLGEESEEKELVALLISAFAKRLKVLSREEPQSVLLSYFSPEALEDPSVQAGYLDRAAWAQAFAFGRPVCNYKVRTGPLKRVAPDRAIAVLYDSWFARYGPREEDTCGFAAKEHRVTARKISRRWIIIDDRIPWP